MTAAQRDLPAMLARAQADLRAAEERVGQLEAKRGEALLEPGHTPAARIDHDLGNERGTIAVLRDKIGLLTAELAKERHEQRERDRVAAIEELEAKFKAKDEAARELEAALAGMGLAFVRYREATAAVFDGWPSDLFGPVALFSQADGVARQVGSALGIQSGAPDIRLAEIADRVGPLAEQVAAASAVVLDALRRNQLPPDVTEIVGEAA